MTKTAQQGTFKEFYRLILFLIPDFNRFLVNRSLVSFVYEGIKLIPVYIVKLIIDDIFGTPDFTKIAIEVGMILVILLLLTTIEIVSFTYIFKKIGEYQKGLLERLHKKLMYLSMAFHEKQSTGYLINRVNKTSHYVNELLWFFNNDIIPTIFQITLTSVLLFYTDWRIGLIYLGILPIILWMISENAKKAQEYRKEYHHVYDQSVGEMTQSMYNIKTVKDYTQEEGEKERYSALLTQYVAKLRKRWKFEMWHISHRETLINIARASTILLAVWLAITNQITPGDVVLIFTLIEKAFLNIGRLGRVYNFLGDAHQSLTQAKAILKEQITIRNPTTPKKAGKQHGTIEFKKVDFAYDTENVLKNINFKIPNKKVLAIIGASGSGKTTLIQLMTRHYDPTKGEVTVDDINLKNLSLKELRKRVAVVSQHTEVFNRTIHENIAYAKPNATRKEVIEAAKKANAHEFIMSFKDKYDTVVGEKGVRLSGGQKQRVSIARALLANPEVLIFDEATSSLDSESELNIQKAIFSAKGRYTMVIIAHRLSTIEHADSVMIMDKGKIAEMGTHKELLRKKNSLYKKMRTLQRLGELRP